MQAWSLEHNEWRRKDMSCDVVDLMGGFVKTMNIETFRRYIEEDVDVQKAFGADLISQAMKLVNDPSRIAEAYTLHRSFGIPDVMVHGDIHANNILLSKNENGTFGDTIHAVIDWQIIHAGSPCEDLARLMLLTADVGVRDQFANTIISTYYSTLADNCVHGVPFTFDVFRA